MMVECDAMLCMDVRLELEADRFDMAKSMLEE